MVWTRVEGRNNDGIVKKIDKIRVVANSGGEKGQAKKEVNGGY